MAREAAANRQRRRIKSAGMLHQSGHLFKELRRNLLNLESEEIFDLSTENQDRDAGGESHRHGVRDILDHRTQARGAPLRKE